MQEIVQSAAVLSTYSVMIQEFVKFVSCVILFNRITMEVAYNLVPRVSHFNTLWGEQGETLCPLTLGGGQDERPSKRGGNT